MPHAPRRLLLAALLSLAPWAPSLTPAALAQAGPAGAEAPAAGPSRPVAPDSPEGAALAARLRDALSSGEWRNVQGLFEQANSPVLAYLAKRWDDMRRGRLDPVAWEVAFDALDERPEQLVGQLSVAARLADGTRVGRRFDVRLARRGDAWRVGEPVRYDDQDARVSAHALALDLRDPARGLQAEDALTVTPSGPDRALYLALLPTLRVASVTWNGAPLRFAQRREVLYVERPDVAGPQVLKIRYAGQLPPSDLDFARPSGAVLRSETRWYPRLAVGAGFCRFSVAITVPAGASAVAVGEAAGVDKAPDGWTYRFDTERPVEGLTVYAGAWETAERQVGPVRLSAYSARAGGGQAAALLGEAGKVLEFYGARFGRYPFHKLALVETDFPGGYGAGSAVALPHVAFEDAGAADEFLPHELAHAWTDLIGYGGSWGERGFLAEGLASYLDLLYRGERDGAAGFRKGLQAAQKRYRRIWNTDSDVALSDADQALGQRAWQALEYDKGAMVWHMLRRQVGEKTFDQTLARLYQARRGQPTGLADFRAAFERASGQHLAYFFDQWLNRAGMPAFSFDGLAVTRDARGQTVVSGSLIQYGTPYAMSVPLVLVSSQADMLYQVPVKAAETRFRLLVRGTPKLMLLDPLGDVLMAPAPAVSFEAVPGPARRAR